jgi:quinol monooxygenase YgiN
MLVNAVLYTFPAEKLDEVKSTLKALRDASRAEPGCITFDVSQSIEDPTAFVLYEEWKDEDALTFHYGTPHFAQYGTEGVRKLAATRIGHRCISLD